MQRSIGAPCLTPATAFDDARIGAAAGIRDGQPGSDRTDLRSAISPVPVELKVIRLIGAKAPRICSYRTTLGFNAVLPGRRSVPVPAYPVYPRPSVV